MASSINGMAEELLVSRVRSSDVPLEVADVVQLKYTPIEGVKNPAVTVFRRPVLSQVGSQDEIYATLGLEDVARWTHPGSFELPSRTQTEFAHTTQVPEVDSWADEPRVLAIRRYD